MSYWCEFEGRAAACVNGTDPTAARAEAERLTGCRVTRIDSLPYPAYPQLNKGTCPAFCHSPAQCRGRGSCPHRFACSN